MSHILVVEDNDTIREGIVEVLSAVGHDVYGARGGKEGLQYFSTMRPDIVITDIKMADLSGMEVLQSIRKESPQTIVMVITAFGTIELAVEAMKEGAFDFIPKPFPPEILRLKVAKAIELATAKSDYQYLLEERKTQSMLLGQSKAMGKLQQQMAKVAPTTTSVLITGESGTGKEVLARSIHAMSQRSHRPLVKVDCSALSKNLLESELFGHEKGAFTGASSRKLGRFEIAHQSSIFLDEIAELTEDLQVKLLRVLQDRRFERVGGNRTIEVDVRVISATNRDLKKEVRSGRFREDLYYRLHIVPFEIPPLRKRKKDIEMLAIHFLEGFSKKLGRHFELSPNALNILRHHSWPGNVRELENVLERICVLSSSDRLGPEDLPEDISKKVNKSNKLNSLSENMNLTQRLEYLEKKLILEAYESCGGVKQSTAKKLGIKTSALYYKMEKYGIV
ncbi:MAG: sigma-54-dependent Fis family transcriptional regulator [Bdellovibrionales bacterium]|nr:sigma-54-dependent Fis family transcriptional regulator [Bdellovibrionales bacterium]